MTSKPRIGIFIPTFQASETVIPILKKIPETIWKSAEEIFIQDNHSDDGTYELVINFRKAHGLNKLRIKRFSKNYGYGGSLKRAFSYSIKKKFDVMVVLHSDGQYPSDRIEELVNLIISFDYDMVQGSRVDRSAGGMPFYKVLGNNFLNWIEEFAFGFQLKEYHSGFNAYRCESLKRIPYLQCSNGFTITADMFAMLKRHGLRVGEIEIPTYYGPEVASVSLGTSLHYGAYVLCLLIKYYLAKLNIHTDAKFRLMSPKDVDEAAVTIVESQEK